MKHTQTYRADIPASLRQRNKDLLTDRGVKIRTTPLKNKILLTDYGAKDYNHPTKEQSCNHRSWCQRLEPPYHKEQSFIYRLWCQRLEPLH
jgi:hypothetical protein